MRYSLLKKICLPCLLSACLGLVLTSCSKSPPPSLAEVRAGWTEKVNEAIKDPVRAKAVDALVGQLLEAQQARAAALELAANQLATMNADYHASHEQLMAVYQDYETKQLEAVTAVKNAIFAIRKQVTAKEWDAIVD